jgi:hypothetical protein
MQVPLALHPAHCGPAAQAAQNLPSGRLVPEWPELNVTLQVCQETAARLSGQFLHPPATGIWGPIAGSRTRARAGNRTQKFARGAVSPFCVSDSLLPAWPLPGCSARSQPAARRSPRRCASRDRSATPGKIARSKSCMACNYLCSCSYLGPNNYNHVSARRDRPRDSQRPDSTTPLSPPVFRPSPTSPIHAGPSQRHGP